MGQGDEILKELLTQFRLTNAFYGNTFLNGLTIMLA